MRFPLVRGKNWKKMSFLIYCILLVITVSSRIEGAPQKKELISGSGRERVVPDGPKLSIKSIPSSTRQRSDLHEIYLAPYRYVSVWLHIEIENDLHFCVLGLRRRIQVEKEISAVVSFVTPDINGVIFLSQDAPPTGPVVLKGLVIGLKPGKHGIHINKLGDVRDKCLMSGHHYNPYNVSW